ncbi:MAG: alkaline phosphatase D family protein [Opitutaceae bacterium]|nr:alkaline phosphatase D family protein [Opitutaceae bacterium]
MNPARLILIALLGAIDGFAQRYEQDQFAPPEAFLPGDPLPYFGSENPFNRRFFTNEKPPRIGQPQLLHLIEGRVAEAIALCRERLATDPLDAESHYVLALAHGRLGDTAAAEQSVEAALASGLPPERVLLPLGELTAPLGLTAAYRRLRAETSRLLHGPLLGAVTPASARFWVRTLGEARVDVHVSARGDFASPDAIGAGRTRAADDHTGVIEVTGLKPATRYRYQLAIDGRALPRPPEWEFATFPAEAGAATVRIAFGGCARYEPANERMWDTIRLRRPDAFMILGDNVYLDLPERTGPFHDYTYYQRQSRPEFRRLAASVPTFAIWDDHDAGIDDVFLGPFTDKPAWKVDHLALFRRNWNNPTHGAEPARPGVWHAFRAGPVECFLLDGRTYRENFLKPGASMLGPVQKAWLLDALKKSTAPFKLLVSPVAWADDAKVDIGPAGERLHTRDTWYGYRTEREELFDFIGAQRISGVVLISSDRHRNDVRLHRRTRGYPLLEIESGWLTNAVGTGRSGETLFEYLDGPAFGFVTATPGTDPTATIEIVTIHGESVFRRELRASELRAP